jgi:hypothetical protein
MNVAECRQMKHRLMLGRAARTQGEVATPYSTTRNAPTKQALQYGPHLAATGCNFVRTKAKE